MKTQRNTATIFVVYNLLNGARVRGIDNAAHLGGLAAGFVMGWLLCRPLNVKRNEQDWTGQWLRAAAVILGSTMVVAYYLSSGQWHPPVIRDPSGRPISFAELAPIPRTFGGVTLGMTSMELVRAKGRPVKRQRNDRMYNSIDSAHDGLLDVYLDAPTSQSSARVRVIIFEGKRDAEPTGVPDLLTFSRRDLEFRYGTPASEQDPAPGFQYLYFRNGLCAFLQSDKVGSYGIYDQPNNTTK
jgi:Rhomboid family